MKTDRIVFNVACYVWLAVLLLGLNVAMQFVSLGLLLFSVVFFSLIDLVLEKFGFPLKLLVAMLIVHRSFYVGSFFSRRWLSWLWADLTQDWEFLLNRGWFDPSPVTGLVVTLLLVIIIQGLYFAFLTRRRGALWLLFIGAALLTGISLANHVNAMLWLFLYVVLGLLIVATTRLRFDVTLNLRKWVSVLLIWVLCLTSVAWALPGADWDIDDWYRRIQDKWDEWRNRDKDSDNDDDQPTSRTYRTGYSVYDGDLGQPLQQDFTRAMVVESPVPVYLRGETRSYYTGRGWRNENFPAILGSVDLRPANVQGEIIEVVVQAEQNFPGVSSSILFAPRYMLEFTSPGTTLQVTGRVNDHGDYLFRARGGIAAGDSYRMQVLIPDDDPELLRRATTHQADDRYRQADVPRRVRSLALDVVADADNAYDKAIALVDFLRGNYRYSLQVDPVPSGVDFVDYFLFEMDRGYCAHFSTAFVLLARCAGLPARWVKGYSSGNRMSGNTFSVLNSHAHAWAEVWFDDHGWVPFEPTPPRSIAPPNTPGGDRPNLPDEDREPPETSPNLPTTPGPEDPGPNGRGVVPQWLMWLGAGFIGVALAAFVALRFGARQHKPINEVGNLYVRLQKRLGLFGWQRYVWETPREHARRVGNQLPQGAGWARLVELVEIALYSGADGATSRQFRRLARPWSLWRLAWHRFARR